MSVLLQISDTHFGTERPEVVEALVDLAAQQSPDLIVLSGDITQRARPAQFRAARAFVDRLQAPVLAIPGNHDIALFDLWSRFVRPYGRYSAAFGADLDPVFETHEWLVIGVNTTRYWRHKNGEVSAAQIDRVSRRLAEAQAGQLRAVVVHQPAAVTQATDRADVFKGHDEAIRAWAAAGADVILGGHIHLPYTLAMNGLARRLWVVQAGTAVSSRTRPGVPNSVNVLRWEPREAGARLSGHNAGPWASLEQWDYSPPQQRFALGMTTAIQPQR